MLIDDKDGKEADKYYTASCLVHPKYEAKSGKFMINSSIGNRTSKASFKNVDPPKEITLMLDVLIENLGRRTKNYVGVSIVKLKLLQKRLEHHITLQPNAHNIVTITVSYSEGLKITSTTEKIRK